MRNTLLPATYDNKRNLIMKRGTTFLIFTIITFSVMISIFSGAVGAADSDGHVLVSLWKSYKAALREDKPLKQAEVLDTIVSEAKTERLHYDFYDAATKRVYVRSSRDWKLRQSLQNSLALEIKDYGEPVVSFCYEYEHGGGASLVDSVLASAERLKGGRNEAFYGKCPLDGVWRKSIGSDYEFALWACLRGLGGKDKAYAALKELLGDSYPNGAYLEYNGFAGMRLSSAGGRYGEKDKEAARNFVTKYKGKAVSLYGEAFLLEARWDSLLRIEDAPSQRYRELYSDCKAFEKRRASFSRGVEAEIAGGLTSVKAMTESLTDKNIVIFGDGRTAKVIVRNLPKVNFRLILDKDGAKAVVNKTLQNQRNSFYLQDTMEVELPACDDGVYILTAKNGSVKAGTVWNKRSLSMASRKDSEGYRIFVADCLTGEPVRNADIALVISGDTVATAKNVALDGFTPLPEEIASRLKDRAASYLVVSSRGADGFVRSTGEHHLSPGWSSDGRTEDELSFCQIFTDRSAYRPGEKVSFKAVLYKGRRTSGFAVWTEGQKVKAELIDTEGKSVSQTELVTNEYGSAAGSFDIPEDRRGGTFILRVTATGVREESYLTVDEFVLPTFDLGFEPDDRLYFLGDTVEVRGRIFSYSGHPLSAAKVTYSVKGSFGVTPVEGSLRPSTDGSFSFSFPTVKGNNDDWSSWGDDCYNVTVKVVDATGETKEFSRSVRVQSDFNIHISLENTTGGEFSTKTDRGQKSGNIISCGTAKVVFNYESRGGGYESVQKAEVEYVLLDVSGKEILSGKARTGEAVDIKVPEPGLYTLKADAEFTSESGKVWKDADETTFLRFDGTAGELGSEVENVFDPAGSCADGVLKTGEDIRIRFGTGTAPVWAVAELFGDRKQLLDSRLVRLDGESGQVAEILYTYNEEWPDALSLEVLYFRDSRVFTFSKSFRRERENLELPLSFSTFKDNSLPGKRCSVVLKSVPGVEAVAAVFDKSTETVAGNEWRPVRLADRPLDRVYIQTTTVGVDSYAGHTLRSSGRVFMSKMAMSDNMCREEEAEVLYDAAPGFGGMAVAEAGSLAFAEAVDNGMEDLGLVAVRSDFASTLAFEPFLRSGKDGGITLDFNTSDKLSTFVVQVWAHSKEMKNSCVRREMTVTIPVKVSVVEPGYLYRGDRLTLKATVSNSSATPVSGTVGLMAYSSADYETSRPFAAKSKKVTVPAGASVPVEFDVDPKDFDTLGLKVVFADDAKSFSDGVFVSLPVKEAEQTLTEAHSAVLLSGMDRNGLVRRLEKEFTGTTAKGAEIREVDIRQMVLDAVPSKVEPEGKDILSLTEALYVRRVAASLGASIEVQMTDAELLSKIRACVNADGGFGWFEGMKSSPLLTAVVLERFAKMRAAGLDSAGIPVKEAVKWLDRSQFLHGDSFPFWRGYLSSAQYILVRSMYPEVPFKVDAETKSEKTEYSGNYKEFRKYVKSYLVPSSSTGRGLNGEILAKARRMMSLKNLMSCKAGLELASDWGVKFRTSPRLDASAAADLESLIEYAVEHPDGGWYYPNAVMPWRGLLESEAYAHSMLCDLLDSVASSSAEESAKASGTDFSWSVDDTRGQKAGKIADGIRLWLMLQKETQKWDDDPAFVDAVNSVLRGSESVLSTKVLTLEKTYRTPFSEISAAGNGFTVERHFYKEVKGEDGKPTLQEIRSGSKLSVGDKVAARYKVWSRENRSFVRLTAPREAALRPVDQLSGVSGWLVRPAVCYWSVTPVGYRNVKTDRTEYWFETYPEENTEICEEFFVTQEGVFTAPVVTVESLYAPHYRANAAFPGRMEAL